MTVFRIDSIHYNGDRRKAAIHGGLSAVSINFLSHEYLGIDDILATLVSAFGWCNTQTFCFV